MPVKFCKLSCTSALGISWQHLHYPYLIVRSVYRFHVYFHVQIILRQVVLLPHENGFTEVKNSYIKSAY